MNISHWQFSKVTDYFDNRNFNCIVEYSKEIESYSELEKQQVYQAISQHVLDYLELLRVNATKEMFLNLVSVVADDIYRSINTADIYTAEMDNYLSASAGQVFMYIKQLGISLHYLTNNTFSDTTRPLKVFSQMYNTIGIIYISPLQAAQFLMEADGHAQDVFDALYPQYKTEAMMIVKKAIIECHKKKLHYMLLIPDGDNNDFELSMQLANTEGVLTVVREDAPQDSSKCVIFYDNVM